MNIPSINMDIETFYTSLFISYLINLSTLLTSILAIEDGLRSALFLNLCFVP